MAFYSKLFGAQPAKRQPGYAKFAIDEPAFKLVLIEGDANQPTVMDHLGVEVFSTEEVTAATTRLTDAGLITLAEDDTECCYALQDKVWVHGPGNGPWEVYVGKADADTLAKAVEHLLHHVVAWARCPAPATWPDSSWQFWRRSPGDCLFLAPIG